MRVRQKVKNQVERLVGKILSDQSSDGSWQYPFDTGILTDCYMIILLRMLGNEDEKLIKGLAKRILKEQYDDGAWRLFIDEGSGNLSLTVHAYYALLLSGYIEKNTPSLMKAKKFILESGGLNKINMFTKIMLSMTGQLKWESSFPIPIEAILLPKNFPINFFDISVFGRSNMAPLLIVVNYKFVMKPVNSPNISELQVRGQESQTNICDETRSVFDFIEHGINQLAGLHEDLHEKALQYLEKYMIEHIEPDGTLYSYFSATFYMISAFLARGASKNDPKITKAVNGLKSMISYINGEPHCQYTTANVWNTALISTAMQNAGLPYTHPNILKANEYLMDRQHTKLGDWAIYNPNILPGGWGFSNVNTINPDVDDTTACLRAIHALAFHRSDYRHAWNRGIQWILSMQNDDGGWAAFEKNVDNPLIKLLPYGEGLLMDASSPDLTGRTLEFLGSYTNINKDHPQIEKGVKWLLKTQDNNGSWNSRWGIYYIYGTWAAVLGLTSVDIHTTHPSIVRAKNWIKSVQNDDGGWGESCRSDKEKQYIPLGESTLTHTAWALDTLIAISSAESPEIQKGINFLIENADIKDWRTTYPKGQGLGGEFYIYYHSYEYVWPLMTLANYLKKFH
ncbi:squalene--hopene cyclase [Heyndrickxia sp. NPDC080065]|uniref:squalene--hopene cyclase n=1 Tax=Heyndrickxia sp. NPDC080065 TaxID=3390568 RepID=UPI003D082E6C